MRFGFLLVAGLLLAGCELGPGERPELYAAVSEDDVSRVTRLLDEGMNPNQVYDGVRVIEEAAVAGSAETVQVPLAAGADPCASETRPSVLAEQAEAQDAERRQVAELLADAEGRC